MKVKVSELPADLRNKLPFTLKTQEFIETKYIPDKDLRREIETYIEIQKLKNVQDALLLEQNLATRSRNIDTLDKIHELEQFHTVKLKELLARTLDIKPYKDIYGVHLITNLAEFILEQIKTFLSLSSFEIPFSPEINLDIHKYLMHTDTPYIKEELYDIIQEFINVLTTELNIRDAIKLQSVDVIRQEDKLYITYIVIVTLMINNELYTLNLNYEVKEE
jgi:hypothetical protein